METLLHLHTHLYTPHAHIFCFHDKWYNIIALFFGVAGIQVKWDGLDGDGGCHHNQPIAKIKCK